MRWIFVFLGLWLISCSDSSDKPDVSHIRSDVAISRFDRDFFSIDTGTLNNEILRLSQKYPSFLPLYFEYFSPITFIARQYGKSFEEAFLEYFRNIKPLSDSVQKRFDKLEKIEGDLENNLKYVKYYYPDFKIPAVLTTVESLNPENPMEIYGTTYYHDTLIISLQMFMGKNFSVYDPSQYPDYIRRRFEPEFIVPNSMRAIANELYSDSSEGSSLIEQMIEKGKRWWLMKKFLPDTPDTLITGYNGKQMQWCKENEGNIWGYINQNENLFSSDRATIQMYIGEAPFTQTLPHSNSGEGAPGNIGAWVGWRIVDAFLKENSKLTIQQVLRTSARKIFQQAKYRPK